MATILQFPAYPANADARAASDTAVVRAIDCEIVFFPGVRYERSPEPEPLAGDTASEAASALRAKVQEGVRSDSAATPRRRSRKRIDLDLNE